MAAIAEKLGLAAGTVVEFGAGDGDRLPLSCGNLIELGMRPLLIESDHDKFTKLSEKYGAAAIFDRVGIGESDSLDVVIGKFSVSPSILIIDIDSIDYHIWDAYKGTPDVVMIEHYDTQSSANVETPVIPSVAEAGRFDSGGFSVQANSEAVLALGASKGYTRVYHNRINSIFVRNDRAEELEQDGPIMLDIGCGTNRHVGYIPIDAAFGLSASKLDLPDESVSEIYASHILEHFGIYEREAVLAEWVRVLKPGGRIRIAVPNLEWWAKKYLERTGEAREDYVYGFQDSSLNVHKSGYDDAGLRLLLWRAGLICVRPWEGFMGDCATLPVSLNLEGIKPTESFKTKERRIAFCMSTPRLGFTDNMMSIAKTLMEFNLTFTKQTGAFWGQCLEREMERALNDGHDWIVACDYDTVWEPDDLRRLFVLMDAHPEADAIAPAQVKREESSVLMGVEEGYDPYLLEPLVKAKSAHFGLTVFRAEALRRMAHPWFLGIPNEDGRWAENRTDDDMYFWKKWAETGNTLYVAHRVAVGHLQMLVSWPSERFEVVHQHINEYQAHGRPKHARH